MLPAMALNDLSDLLTQYMVAMLRIGAFLLASPVFGGRFVPLPVRIMATAVIALPIITMVDLPTPDQIAGLNFVGTIMAELTIGLVSGLILSILFGAAALAGDRIASTAGLGFAAQFDPAAGGQTPVVSSIFGLFLFSVFLGTDSHLIAIRMILESYQTLPIGGSLKPDVLIAAGIEAGGMMFALGAAMMLPVVAVLLLLNIVIGVLTRSAPQLNVFSFGFPITMTATMLLIYAFAPQLMASFDHLLHEALGLTADMLGAESNG